MDGKPFHQDRCRRVSRCRKPRSCRRDCFSPYLLEKCSVLLSPLSGALPGGVSLFLLFFGAALFTSAAAATPPSITTQPSSLIVTQGNSASFTILASGDAPLNYQWRLFGSPLGGATS